MSRVRRRSGSGATARIRRAVPALVLAATAGLAGAPAAEAAPYCGQRWGSLPEGGSLVGTMAPLVEVRAGRHACFDRLVLEVAGPASGYVVRYVPQVRQDGSGHVVPLRGGARLEVLLAAPAYDEFGRSTIALPDHAELVPVGGFRTFRQVAWGGSFEALTTVGVGVRARLPFRAWLLPGPGERTRLVVDVAHRW